MGVSDKADTITQERGASSSVTPRLRRERKFISGLPMRLLSEVPAPCPAPVSILMRVGKGHHFARPVVPPRELE